MGTGEVKDHHAQNTVGLEDSEQVHCLDDHTSQMRLTWFSTSWKASIVISISTGIHPNTRREAVWSHLLLTSLIITLCVLNKVLACSPYPKYFSSFPKVHVKEGKQSYRTTLRKGRILKPSMPIQAESSDMKKRGLKKKKIKTRNKRDPLLCNCICLNIDKFKEVIILQKQSLVFFKRGMVPLSPQL